MYSEPVDACVIWVAVVALNLKLNILDGLVEKHLIWNINK